MTRATLGFGVICCVWLALSACDKKAKAGESCKFDKECPAEHLCFQAKCTATSQVMEAATKACKADPQCAEMGQCTPRLVGYQTLADEERWKCYAVTEQDCAGSKVCKTEGLCRAQNDLCGK